MCRPAATPLPACSYTSPLQYAHLAEATTQSVAYNHNTTPILLYPLPHALVHCAIPAYSYHIVPCRVVPYAFDSCVLLLTCSDS